MGVKEGPRTTLWKVGGGGYPGRKTEPESPAGGSRSRSQQVTSALEGEAGLRLPAASLR